jgi:hypothetical protein
LVSSKEVLEKQAIQNNNISLEIPEIFNISDEILNNIDEKGSELKKIIRELWTFRLKSGLRL